MVFILVLLIFLYTILVVSVVSFWSLGSFRFNLFALVISVVLHVSLVSYRFAVLGFSLL